MTADSLNLHKMVRDAHRGVVRTALKHVEEHGLPGVHYFNVTYDTQYRGVRLSSDLLARYPEYIKIVLQHDFRDLVVEDDRFSVTLHFGGMPHRIVVPFQSILVFEDPTEKLVLYFEPDSEADGSGDEDEEILDSEAPAGSLQLSVRAVLAAADRMQAEKEAQEETEDVVAPEESEEGPGDENQVAFIKPADIKPAEEHTVSEPAPAAVADHPSAKSTGEAVFEPLPAPAALEAVEEPEVSPLAEVSPVSADDSAKDEDAEGTSGAGKEIAKDSSAKGDLAKDKITKDNVVSIDAFRRK